MCDEALVYTTANTEQHCYLHIKLIHGGCFKGWPTVPAPAAVVVEKKHILLVTIVHNAFQKLIPTVAASGLDTDLHKGRDIGKVAISCRK